jgi:serine/threonine protein kinase
VGVHDYIKREIANSEKYYSTLLDHWHEVEGE